jgi:DNA-binding CsgD family transcriptional regulator
LIFFYEREAMKTELSPREKEVLQWMATGRRAVEIGVQLGISAKTVEAHRQGIGRKLETWGGVQAVMHGIILGYIKMPVLKNGTLELTGMKSKKPKGR